MKNESLVKFLYSLYDLAVSGVPGQKPVAEVVEELQTSGKVNAEMVRTIIVKESSLNFGSSFVTSFGGIFTLPLSISAEFSSSLYLQLRMNCLIAALADYDLADEKIKALVLSTLLGEDCYDLVDEQNLGDQFLKNLTGATLLKFNKMLATKLLKKFGKSTVFSVNRWIPFVSGLWSGSTDAYTCFKNGKIAQKIFFGEYLK